MIYKMSMYKAEAKGTISIFIDFGLNMKVEKLGVDNPKRFDVDTNNTIGELLEAIQKALQKKQVK